MSAKGTVLIVDDDAAMRLLLAEELNEAGYRALTAAGGEEALAQLDRWPVDVVVTDLMMSGMKGDELLQQAREREPDLPVVIITAFGTIDSAVEAIKTGAYHYVAKPFRLGDLLLTLENAVRERRLRQEVERLRGSPERRPPRSWPYRPPCAGRSTSWSAPRPRATRRS
jgi:two-component system response regulator HydG